MRLNNIIRISSVPSASLSGYLRLGETEATFNADAPFRALSGIRYPSQLTVSDKREDGAAVFTAKLVFLACGDWMEDARRLAFLCETSDGDKYLIGTGESPYPVITQQQVHPDNYSDSQLTEVTVTWLSAHIPPKIRFFG